MVSTVFDSSTLNIKGEITLRWIPFRNHVINTYSLFYIYIPLLRLLNMVCHLRKLKNASWANDPIMTS